MNSCASRLGKQQQENAAQHRNSNFDGSIANQSWIEDGTFGFDKFIRRIWWKSVLPSERNSNILFLQFDGATVAWQSLQQSWQAVGVSTISHGPFVWVLVTSLKVVVLSLLKRNQVLHLSNRFANSLGGGIFRHFSLIDVMWCKHVLPTSNKSKYFRRMLFALDNELPVSKSANRIDESPGLSQKRRPCSYVLGRVFRGVRNVDELT
jgi:hypothetical protein